MNTEEAYNQWSGQYDTNINRTRDLEAIVLRMTLANIRTPAILEIGCGTGKNSVWLAEKATTLIGVDLSPAMLAIARTKLPGTLFIQADITQAWDFTDQSFDLITFSLVLEHIADLDLIFSQAAQKLRPGGKVYIGELHPFKQYTGSKARFETDTGTTVVDCYTHHISEFTNCAGKNGLALVELQEWWDDDNREDIPRIFSLLLQKN